MVLLNQNERAGRYTRFFSSAQFYVCAPESYTQAWGRSIALLLDDDGQVHIQVDATIEMEGAGRAEWSNGHTLTGSVELQVGDDRCTRFSRWFDDVIHPGAIANNM